MIDGTSGGDGVNPSRKLRVSTKRAQVLPHGNPDLLADIASAVFVTQHGINEPENGFVVAAHQRSKRILIAGLRALDEVALGFRGDFNSVGHRTAGTKTEGRSCPIFITGCDARLLLCIHKRPNNLRIVEVRRFCGASVTQATMRPVEVGTWAKAPSFFAYFPRRSTNAARFAAWRTVEFAVCWPEFMFTGIIEETGRVLAFEANPEAWNLTISARAALADITLGDSIAVNGCCLTVTEFNKTSMRFDVLEETRRLTNFAELGAGALVNLERSLRFGGKVGGHFVTGHIDALGRVDEFEARGKDHYLRVTLPEGFTRYIVHKGSIAIDGISLTIAEVAEAAFAVWIIPHTLTVTNLGKKRVRDAVNLEFDLLGKHVEKLLLTRTS